MIFEKNQTLKMIIEVSFDNLEYNSVLEFNKAAFRKVLEGGWTESEFIINTFNSCGFLKYNPSIKSYRLRVQSQGKEFFIFENWQLMSAIPTNQVIIDSELDIQRKKFKSLTPKELVVLEYNLEGACKNRIKNELNIQHSTFKVHLKRIYRKLDIHSGKQFLKWCDRFLSSVKK